MQNSCAPQIQEMLKSKIKEFRVVTMPDFFLDRLVNLNKDIKTFFDDIERVAENKGGSLDYAIQAEIKGGNAVNTASALVALGLRATPIICTDRIGSRLIESYLDPLKMDLAHLKILKGRPSLTTAIEFQKRKERINVMLRDVGALENFSHHDLSSDDFEVIESADYVCVFNWTGTKRFGTELARTVFEHVKKAGKGKTYLDTADPTPNAEKIPQLIKKVMMEKHLDILSVNENEAFCYAKALNKGIPEAPRSSGIGGTAIESARALANAFQSRIDLHTTNFSGTFNKRHETIVPAFDVPTLRATGAGDAWNAGNILGDAVGLPEESRLTLANAVAAYYVSSQEACHPTRKQLSAFLNTAKTKILNRNIS